MVDEGKISQQIDSLVSKLQGRNNIREAKYITNYSRYQYNGLRRDDLWTPFAQAPIFFAPAQRTAGVQTQFNLTKSVIDTIVSKISQANVRPYFNSVRGDYDTSQLCSALQRRFDVWLDEQHAYPKTVLAFRDAAIFDVGVMFCNPMTQGVERVQPWKYFIDPGEYESGYVSQCLIWEKYYPLLALKDRIENESLKKVLQEDPRRQGKYARFWDLYRGEFYEQFDGLYLSDPVAIDYEQYGGLYRRPFTEIFYTKPVKGFLSRSLADDLYPIQRNIDVLIMRLDEAFRNAVSSMGFFPSSGGVKVTNIENGVSLYSWDGSADGGRPFFITPPAVDPQFIENLNMWIEKGYEQAGISQLSAQAKKPAGLDSGKALDTMEDIESDRFNTQLQQFTHLQVDMARVCIDCFPKSEAIINDPRKSEKVRWGDARKQRKDFRLQFSAADALSKDPEEKRNEIEFYLQQGLLDKGMMADLIELPDLEEAETLASASYKHCQKIIHDALVDEDFDFDETVDFDDLLRYCIIQANVLAGNGDKQEYMQRINKLIQKVAALRDSTDQLNQPPPPQAPPTPPKNLALDGSQIDQIKEIAMSVQKGELSAPAALAIAQASFPKVPAQLLQQIFQGVTPQAPNGQLQNVNGAQNGRGL